MKLMVLGTSAGGGFPQWNCNCPNCVKGRDGTWSRDAWRTQSSIAISTEADRWLLINASPDIREQLLTNRALQPQRSTRDTGIAAVLTVDAQIDHTSGLLFLREHTSRLPLYTTQSVYEDLSQGFPLIPLLDHYCGIDWHCLPDNGTFVVAETPGLSFTSVALISNAPPYSPHRDQPVPGDNIGLIIADQVSGRKIFYAPGLGVLTPEIEAIMADVDLILVDGTCWTNDEMAKRGVGHKSATAMGHLPQSGDGGMIDTLTKMTQARKVLIHINNTNPILDPDSVERQTLNDHNIEVSSDGMLFEF